MPTPSRPTSPPPFLRRVASVPERWRPASGFPFDVPALRGGVDLTLDRPITFLVGENGTGKSTLLEAIADASGFDVEGGSRDHRLTPRDELTPLAAALRLSWLPKVQDGFFLRAESLYNVASYLDDTSTLSRYGGRSLHAQSHGESFLSLILHRFERGLFLLDEPESALSPQRQLSLLRVLYDLEQAGRSQLVIATHSPILLAYPGAAIFSLDGGGIEPIAYTETWHYQLTRDFLNGPERFFRHLFGEG